jgi:succinate dehydrogenase (ubiquinone) cytochrome b560 subunit
MRRSFAEATKLSYTARQAKLGRPISPHVTIYAFPVVSLSSITVRVTGVLLTIGTTGVAGT